VWDGVAFVVVWWVNGAVPQVWAERIAETGAVIAGPREVGHGLLPAVGALSQATVIAFDRDESRLTCAGDLGVLVLDSDLDIMKGPLSVGTASTANGLWSISIAANVPEDSLTIASTAVQYQVSDFGVVTVCQQAQLTTVSSSGSDLESVIVNISGP
jgi:hypothetical protein